MKKQKRIHGFIDLSSLKVGGRMLFNEANKWFATSPIVKYTVFCGKILCETQNTVYRNY